MYFFIALEGWKPKTKGPAPGTNLLTVPSDGRRQKGRRGEGRGRKGTDTAMDTTHPSIWDSLL